MFEGEDIIEGVHPVFGKYSIGEFSGKDRSAECCLAVDIGATNTMFAVLSTSGLDCFFAAYFKSRDKETFMKQFDMVRRMAEERDLDVRYTNIGAAGPVVNNRTTFITNLKWQLDASELGDNVFIYNDFEAIAHGIGFLDHNNPKQIIRLNKVRPDKGVVAVIGPGTGLGMSTIVDGKVVPSEGGHSDMVVQTEEELRLVQFLKKMLKTEQHPGWETVVSGPGIVNLYRFVMQDPRLKVDPVWITGSDEKGAVTATDMFIEFFARVASDLALEVEATGGLYLAGGISSKLKQRLVPHFMETFLESYNESIRSAVLERIPVFLVMEQRVSLLGLAHLVNLSSQQGAHPAEHGKDSEGEETQS